MSHIKVPVAAHLLLFQDNMVLLSRRYQTGFEDGNYSVIAGHIEKNESIIETMIREAKEEANIEIDKQALDIVHVMFRKSVDETRVDYFFVTKKWQNEIVNNEPDKCDLIEWFDIDRLPDNMVPYVREAISHYRNGNKFSVFGWDDK